MDTLLMAGAPVAAPIALTQDGHLGLGGAIVSGVVALVIVACGVGALTTKRAVNVATDMIGIMASLAVLYIVNRSPFMSITQVAVYTGTATTLALFVITLVGVDGDEPMGATSTVMRRPVLVLLGLGLAGVLTIVMRRSILPKPAGPKDDAKVASDLLAVALYHDHVVTMGLTVILPVVAAVGALILTRRQCIRARLSQRVMAVDKIQDYAAKGARPGQKPTPGVYASTNPTAVPALDTQGEAVEESVPRVLRTRGQGLGPSDVSLEMGLAQRSGTIVSRPAGAGQIGRIGSPRDTCRSGMPPMPGVATPTIKQPILNDDGAVDLAAPKQEEEKWVSP